MLLLPVHTDVIILPCSGSLNVSHPLAPGQLFQSLESWNPPFGKPKTFVAKKNDSHNPSLALARVRGCQIMNTGGIHFYANMSFFLSIAAFLFFYLAEQDSEMKVSLCQLHCLLAPGNPATLIHEP